MTPDHFHARPANAERFRDDNDDPVLLSRMRMVISESGFAAAFVMILVFQYLGEIPSRSLRGARGLAASRKSRILDLEPKKRQRPDSCRA